MDKKMFKLLKRIDKRLDNLDVTMAKNTTSLEIHVKRTDLLEAKLEPVEKHVAMMHGAFKLIGLLATLAGIGAAIVEGLKWVM